MDPLSQAFSAAGLAVLVARDTPTAQQAIAGPVLPGGVIIDLLTVDDDPEALCDALRSLPEASGVPLLFIGTGAESVRSTTDALIAGGDGFFQLPIEAGRVVAKIAAYVGTPVPSLPSNLLVTIDEHDLLERTPEPVRLVPPARTPAQLLGEDDDDALFAGALQDSTPPSGTSRPEDASWPSMEGQAFAPASQEGGGFGDDDDFADVTAPLMRRPPGTRLPKTQSIDDGEAILDASDSDEAHVGDDADNDGDDDAKDDAHDVAATQVTSLSEAQREHLQDVAVPVAPPRPSADSDDDHFAGDKTALMSLDAARHALKEESDEARAAVVAAEAEIAALHARRDEMAAGLLELERSHQQQREEAAAALEGVLARRQAAEDDLVGLEEEARSRRAEEEARLEAIEAARAEAEGELRALDAAKAAQRSEDEAQLAVLKRQKQDAEEALQAVHQSADDERQAEVARLDEARAERRRLEGELAALRAAQDSAMAEEEARVRALQEERAKLEAERDGILGDATRRAQEEAAELEILAGRRAALAEELEAAEAERVRRLGAEAQEVEALTAQKQVLEEAARQAEAERGRRTVEAEAELLSLLEQREALEAELARWADEATGKAADEENRLLALEAERQLAEQALEKARAAQERRLQDEQARLANLEAERALREEAMAELAAAGAARQEEEEAKLAALGAQRAEQESKLADLVTKAAEAEERTAERLAELERVRIDSEQEVLTLKAIHEQRQQETEAAIAALEVERARVEAETAAQQERLALALVEEEARLKALADARAEREASLSALEAAERKAVAEQEERLRVLSERAQAERDRLAEQAVAAEAEIAVERERARSQLAVLRQEQETLIEAARAEAEHLAQLRAEHEATRASLQEAKSRARLAFQSGRFDALPPGHSLGGHNVGADGRSSDEGFATMPYGGERADVTAALDKEPPAPLPFVAIEPPEGRFVEGDLPALLLSAHQLQVTGAIQLCIVDDVDGFDDVDNVRTLYLEEGEPVFVASTAAADRPEESLLKAGLITAGLYATLRPLDVVSARRLCAQLVADQHLKIEELFPAVRGVLTEQLLSLVGLGAGRYRFVEERAHPSDRVRLEHHFDAVVAEGVRRKYDEARLWNLLGGPQTLLGATDLRRPLPPMSPEERLVLERLDGTRTLDDLVFGDGVHAHVVLRAAALGIAAGAIAVLARGLPVDLDDVVNRRHRSLAIDRGRIVDRAALARHGDYFTFLGVGPEATPFEVQRAAHRLRERFDPARYQDAAFADLRAALREIVDVAGDAEAVLGDSALKEAYRRNLRAQGAPTSQRGRSQRAG